MGGAGVRGISGGQRRRVSIGMEVLTSARIVFLDEPTSGLDAASAAEIMQFLKRTAARNNIIIIWCCGHCAQRL